MFESLLPIWQTILENLVDIVIYTATGITFLVGLFKCVFPLRHVTKCLRRAERTLAKLPPRDSTRPVWQNELFMGKKLTPVWRRFLTNAEQLDARGLTCDVRDYINDDSTVYAFGHIPLSELIPGLLTSLGILGTFIGLVRGLGGLDVSDAAKTMESIPTMIGGMTFAFTTSIAGISCSLLFNLSSRMAQGGATRALDDFQEAFSELAMQTPLADGTQAICQREDQTAFLRHAVGDLGNQMADKVSGAVESTLVPVTQAMNSFILGQTQSQVEGLSMITQRFIEQMNGALSGQFVQLGQTLSAISRSQQTSYVSLERAMAAADQVMENLSVMQQVTEGITQRFDGYVHTLSDSREQEDEFTRRASEVVGALSRAAAEQTRQMEEIKRAQTDVKEAVNDYALRSKQTMQLICDRADQTGKAGAEVAKEMKDSGKLLKDSYGSFVQNVTSGLSMSMGLFDKNMNDLMNALQKRVAELSPNASGKSQGELVDTLTKLTEVMTDIEETLKHPRKEA